tara:strand:- start:1371 stop:1856 length:486 start_codon:yes stop_codon:yes gene_type:complete
MGNLTQEIERQIARPTLEIVVRALEQSLQQNTPSVSGNLKSSLFLRKTGTLTYTLYGPDYAQLVDQGMPAPVSDKWTRSHRQRYKGTLKWVTRTYTNYMRPQKLARLIGTPQGPWRVLQNQGRMGYGFIAQSMADAFKQVFSGSGQLKGALPDTIEVTSLA